MPITTILLITLAALFALGFVFFKYFWKVKNTATSIWFLAAFRFISIFVILLLLINPTITILNLEIEKPNLFIAVDQSASIDHLGVNDSVKKVVEKFETNQHLQDKFSIQTYGFGKELEITEGDSMNFDKQQTNISGALRDLSKMGERQRSVIVLLSDGNQTIGEDYQYFKAGGSSAILPVIAGDTTTKIDLSITNLNVNKYAFLNNRFPVEVIVNYSGKSTQKATFEIGSGNATLYSQKLEFGPGKNSEVITTTLPANSIGTRVYEARLTPLEGENNLVNNISRFGITVVDEKTSVLILAGVSHPDLGVIKKSIEQNEQREATIEYLPDFDLKTLKDYQLVILYQPNSIFKTVWDSLKKDSQNFLVITGLQTDWNLVNEQQSFFEKDYVNQPQEVFGLYNKNYSRFQFEDIDFSKFPPLTDAFGSFEFNNSVVDALLYQQIEGILTTVPLLLTLEVNSAKQGYLFGEGLWKWRAQSFVDKGSFESFDDFFGKLVQFLSASQKRDRLTFEAESFYPENSEVLISARYYDETYQFDPSGELFISIKDTTNKDQTEQQAQMLLNNNRYEVILDNLPAGDYQFEIRERSSGISRIGSFTIIEYNIEQHFSSANLGKMKMLAENNSSTLYFLNNPDSLIQDLLEDSRYTTLQKSREKAVSLISWKILLFLLILSLGAEWFTRKYFGLI